MSCFDSCVADAVDHRCVGDRVCVRGGGVGEEPAMVLLRCRRTGGRCCRSHHLVCVNVVCESPWRRFMAFVVGVIVPGSPVAGGGDGNYEPARVLTILSAYGTTRALGT
jgi:hypothetical protein